MPWILTLLAFCLRQCLLCDRRRFALSSVYDVEDIRSDLVRCWCCVFLVVTAGLQRRHRRQAVQFGWCGVVFAVPQDFTFHPSNLWSSRFDLATVIILRFRIVVKKMVVYLTGRLDDRSLCLKDWRSGGNDHVWLGWEGWRAVTPQRGRSWSRHHWIAHVNAGWRCSFCLTGPWHCWSVHRRWVDVCSRKRLICQKHNTELIHKITGSQSLLSYYCNRELLSTELAKLVVTLVSQMRDDYSARRMSYSRKKKHWKFSCNQMRSRWEIFYLLCLVNLILINNIHWIKLNFR